MPTLSEAKEKALNASIAVQSRVLRNDFPVTDWSADRPPTEPTPPTQSSFVTLGLLSLAFGILSASLSHDRLNPYYHAAEHFFGDPINPSYRKQTAPLVDPNWDFDPQVIHGTLPPEDESKKVEEQGTWASVCPDGECTHPQSRGETADAAIDWKKNWDKSLRAACDKRPGFHNVPPAENLPKELHFMDTDARPSAVKFFHESRPMLDTVKTKPFVFDEFVWDDAPSFLSQLFRKKVSREDDFRIITPSPVVTLTAEEAAAKPCPISGQQKEREKAEKKKTDLAPETETQQPISSSRLRCRVCGVLNQSKTSIEQDAFLCTFSIVSVNPKTLLCDRPPCKRTRAIAGEYHAEELRKISESFEPTEEELGRWRKKYSKTDKDGKTTFKRVSPPRFQTTSHDSAFRKNADFDSVVAVYREDSEGKLTKTEESFFEDGTDTHNVSEEISWIADAALAAIGDDLEANETTEAEEVIQSNQKGLERSIEEVLATTWSLILGYEDSRLPPNELKRKYSLPGEMRVQRLQRHFAKDKPRLERMQSEAVPLTPIIVNKKGTTIRMPILIAAPLHVRKTDQDEWEARLARAFRDEFDARCLRDDVEFESWRREAKKQAKWNQSYRYEVEKTQQGISHRYDDVTWCDILNGNKSLNVRPTHPPSWGRQQHSYRPEIRGLKVGKGSSANSPESWFDHVFDGQRVKTLPSDRVVEEILKNKKGKERAKFQMVLEIVYDRTTVTEVAKAKGIKKESVQRMVQRAENEIEQYQTQTKPGLFDPTRLSPKDIYLILEKGGSFIVLPGDKKDTIEVHRVDVEPRSPEFQGMLDGLQGYKSEDEWLGSLEMEMYRSAVAKVNGKNLSVGKRNRALAAERKRLTERFSVAEVIHFGDPENLREEIVDRLSLKKDDEVL